jgi:hypothetical protein
MSIARLWRDQDKRDHARELLGLIYGRFNAGFDMLGMKEHKRDWVLFSVGSPTGQRSDLNSPHVFEEGT